jgi:SAM-dependent methyltransferase
VGDDRWWRGFDAVVVDAAAPGSRVLDVGCGDGGLVDRLAAGGLDALGVDPQAPPHPRLMRQRVEELGSIGRFDVVCAVMTLHHVELDSVLAAIARLLRPGGRLLACEFAWEAYDERAASWLARHDRSGADNSVAAWRHEHADLHTSATLQLKIGNAFDLYRETPRPYLASMLGNHELEDEEQAMIAAGALPALGRWYFARRDWRNVVRCPERDARSEARTQGAAIAALLPRLRTPHRDEQRAPGGTSDVPPSPPNS